MKISVKVKPQAREDRIERIGENKYTVWVKAKAIENKANQAAIKLLSKYFDIAKSKIVLLKGERSRDKVFNLLKN
jgi:uncharacterized protein (TIGR00251 family)